MSCPTIHQHPLRKQQKNQKPQKSHKNIPVLFHLLADLQIQHHICALRWPRPLFLPPRHAPSLLLLLLLLHQTLPTRLFVVRDVPPLVLLHSTVPLNGFVPHFMLHHWQVVIITLLIYTAVWRLPLVHHALLRAPLIHPPFHWLPSLSRSLLSRAVPDPRPFTN